MSNSYQCYLAMPEKSLRTPEILTTNQKVPGETLKVKVHPIPIKKIHD